MMLGIEGNAEISFMSEDESSSNSTATNDSASVQITSLEDKIRSRVFSYMQKKPTITMVIEAVGLIGSDEGGASVQAITKWIIANYAVLDVDKVKTDVKKAVLKALYKGIIERSETSKNALGPCGSFVIRRNKKKNLSKNMTKSVTPNEKTKNKRKSLNNEYQKKAIPKVLSEIFEEKF